MMSSDDSGAIRSVLDFWFGETVGDWCVEDRNELWWYENPAVDEQIFVQFGSLHSLAINRKLQRWAESPRGRLALIVLLDQFSRNIYRKSAAAFSGDALSLELCLEGKKQKHDMELKLIERVFFYMPLMHAEDRDLQEASLSSYAAIHEAAEAADKEKSERYVGAAKLHADIVFEFGRYPHRNALLQRENTSAEDTYLASSRETFGQS